jgi:hypothetical protein
MSSSSLALARGRCDATSTVPAIVTKDADNKDFGFGCDAHNSNVVISRTDGAGNVCAMAISILVLQSLTKQQ